MALKRKKKEKKGAFFKTSLLNLLHGVLQQTAK